MADIGHGEYGTAYYRSNDPVKNLRIKVKLRRVTASSILPIAAEQQPGEGGAGEGVEMASRQQTTATEDDEEVYTFNWQEKLFCQREVQFYSTVLPYFSPLEHKYHDQLRAFEVAPPHERPTNKRLFSYTNFDEFNADEGYVEMTDSPTEVPTTLATRIRNVRHRKVGGADRRRRDTTDNMSPVPKSNIVVAEPSDDFKHHSHLISTTAQTMYLMADLSPSGTQYPIPADEYVLCTVKVDANGLMSVKPDFNRHRKAYVVITDNDRREAYEYTLQNVSQEMNAQDKLKEAKMYTEMYNRHAEFIATCVGTEFNMPSAGHLGLSVFGEIVSAKNYEYDGLFIHYFIDLPQYWQCDQSQQLYGITQRCSTKAVGREDVAYFSYPFDVHLDYHCQSEEESANCRWPQIYFEVMSLDSWQRYRVEGYGYLNVPNTPGVSTHEVTTWRPIGNSLSDQLRRYFTGQSAELEDPTYIATPTTHEGKVLSKYGFRTITTGSITVKLNVIMHSRTFIESAKSRKVKTRALIDNLGGHSMQATISHVLQAFKKARLKMKAAREGLINTG